jgi:PQQ-dependent catabolism-associated CXXCW motif protein
MRRIGAGVLLAMGWAMAAVQAKPGIPEPDGYRMDDYRAPTPETVAGGRVVHTDEVRRMVRGGGAVLIDVLPAPRRPDGMKPGMPWMPLPHSDLPGSIWLPDVGRGQISPAMEAWFRQRLATESGGDKGRILVFYCLADCWMSWNAAKRAVSYGYRQVYWYPDGTDGWQAAGETLERANAATPPE